MQLSPKELEKIFPYYLTAPQKEAMAKAISEFPNCNYYLGTQPDLLQGDGLSGLEIISLETAERAFIKGIVISNSCDVAAENPRALPPLITFAPLIELGSFEARLKGAGLTSAQIADKLRATRAQEITNLFYLPASAGLNSEHIALLDDVKTIHLKRYEAQENKTKFFSLSQMGFYIFLIKLSIHFCRMHENVARFEAA
ncbi:hypothetical protein [Herbaspirillum seropedicae]|uniref:hypothetical protein n=1 Tax=Herbaspirillum seropedicae TaxID=964 RepID=UPI003D95379C